MNLRELILLTPFRLPGKHSLMLGVEDMAAFLNGFTMLWHPAALSGASSPPRISSPYDHEQPRAGHIYAVPISPPLLLPDDWDDRVKSAGAIAFRSTEDRTTTLENLRSALGSMEGQHSNANQQYLNLSSEQLAPFFGVGFGYAVVEALFEAMEHDNQIAGGELWQDVQSAAAALASPDGAEVVQQRLRQAAERLQAAREVLYPVTIHLLDVAVLDARSLDRPSPATFQQGLPCNFIAASEVLEQLGQTQREWLTALRDRVATERVEVCTAGYRERADALLPLESQLWNLTHGLEVARTLIGQEPRVFGRKRFWSHPQLATLLQHVGLQRALLLPFDEARLPVFRSTVTSLPAPSGKQIEVYPRMPAAAELAQTYFHLAHSLHETIMQDQAGTLALLHLPGTPPASWYEDLIALSRLAPVLGQWTTFSRYFNDVMAGEYASAATADEYHADYLTELTTAQVPYPVSSFAQHARLRRRVDAAWTLTALLRSLGPTGRDEQAEREADRSLTELETEVEKSPILGLSATIDQTALRQLDARTLDLQQQAGIALARRLVSRTTGTEPGFLILNPCSFTRRIAVELQGFGNPLPAAGPIKASQVDQGVGRLVVEVPSLGFTWFSRSGPAGTTAPARIRLADERGVRNEFFEADVDPATGGLRAIRDHKTRISRLGQMLVFNPGSSMRASRIAVSINGPALGEVVSEGAVVSDDDGRVLAHFRQRFRAWLGRPLLELRIEIMPEHVPHGYPWHAYYGARFAWRDERATLLRSVAGCTYVTAHTRPETPDYLELRMGRQATTIFSGGLPFHQRHGGRMLDVILVPEGEKATTFDLALGLEREHPAQTALGLISPAPVIPVETGPPHVGATGWLFHLDAANLLLTGLRPVSDGADALLARLQETTGAMSQAALRCVRNPARATLQDLRGNHILEPPIDGDAVVFELAPHDLGQLRIDFS